ncbi:MAG: hypothetical protein HKO06_11645 [Pseudomonadales bacterium]|nr:hypothetical protein [Pseudomonadales bacterium]
MLSLGKSWRVHASDELIDRLREMCGEQAVRVRYRRSPSESHGAGFAHSSSNRAQAH